MLKQYEENKIEDIKEDILKWFTEIDADYFLDEHNGDTGAVVEELQANYLDNTKMAECDVDYVKNFIYAMITHMKESNLAKWSFYGEPFHFIIDDLKEIEKKITTYI